MRTSTLASRPAPGRLTTTALAVALQLAFAPTAQAGGWLTGTQAFTPANNWTSAVTNITPLPTYNNLFFTDKI
ncbi:MAG: hypothetical protein Q8O79_03465, partial [Pseudomonadota bacterium]|nr:hypothetical protein [Pseudomonadota bacterium]